jgi:hypothetical protein
VTQDNPVARRGRGEAKPPAPPPLSPQEQAAIAFARENREPYGKRWRRKEMQYTVIDADPRPEGNMLVTVTYRPAGTFKGRPGEETITVAPNGEIVERVQVQSPQEVFPWALAVITLASFIAAPILIWLIWTSDTRGIDPLYVSGRILWIRLENEPTLVPAIHYQNPATDGRLINWSVTPEDSSNVLAMVKVTLTNQLTSQARVLIDEESAKLLSTAGVLYSPTNIVTASKQIGSLDSALIQRGFVGLWRTVTINAGESLIGWMVFEVPPGTDFREFRWEASDTVNIRF